MFAALLVGSPSALAENRVAELSRLLSSRSDKTRLSAVLALAKLGDPEALKPLVVALGDSSVRVRAVAATALGRLECNAALPTLRTLATEDRDPDVRKAASTAAIKISTASRRHEGVPRPDGDPQARRAALASPRAIGHADAEVHPALYLLIKSSADDSPGRADRPTRVVHAEIIKRVLAEQLRGEASVTSAASDARRWGLEARHIDLSVIKLDIRRLAGQTEIDAQLRVAISDDNGKMLSFLSGGAKLQVPSNKLDAKYLPALRRDALENAMRGMFGKLMAHLHDQASM